MCGWSIIPQKERFGMLNKLIGYKNVVLISVKVKLFTREAGINKWEIVCVVLQRGSLNVTRNLVSFTLVYMYL